MKVVDIDNWCRKTQYSSFVHYTNPVFSVGTRLDVTSLLEYCKNNRRPFFSSFLFLVATSMNCFEEWRSRIIGDNVVIFEKTHPSYVVLREDDSITTCLTEITESYEEFCNQARKDIDDARSIKNAVFNPERRIDCIYVSCLPWIDFTSVMNPYNFTDAEQTSIPRITWGKYVEQNGKYEMAFDISAHHALVDGVHAARLVKKMEEFLSDPDSLLGD